MPKSFKHTAFGSELRNSYNADFSEDQGLFNELHGNLSQIVAQGPSQQGFSAPELAADNSQVINSAAASAKDVAATIGEKAGVENTANPGVESGVTEAVKASAATKVANNLANEEEGITQANYKQGNENYEAAVKGEEELPEATEAPVTQAANPVNQNAQETSTQANANAAASTSWEGLVGGIVGGAAKGLMSGLGSGGGGLDPHADPNSAGLFQSTTPTDLSGEESAFGTDWLPTAS